MDTAAPRVLRLAAALVAVLTSACAPASHTPRGNDVSSAGRSFGVPNVASATRGPLSLTESRTASLALDRIDQHDLPLDHTYHHVGTGRGVTVYVFDGGILDTHPELAGRVRRGYDAFPGKERVCNAHGTAVAGAVAGTTLGVAPEAEVVDVKIVECSRMRGSVDAIVRATHWALADHARHPERRAVANWSFVADTAAAVPALDTAVAQLRAAGIPVVVSVGNIESDACRISPANAPGVIAVGASRVVSLTTETSRTASDARAPHTAFGACVDVFAPGDSVLLPSMTEDGVAVNQLWSGTSMAAGYVSGAIALYFESEPTASVTDVTAVIEGRSAYTMIDERSPRAGMLYVGPVTAGRRAERALTGGSRGTRPLAGA